MKHQPNTFWWMICLVLQLEWISLLVGQLVLEGLMESKLLWLQVKLTRIWCSFLFVTYVAPSQIKKKKTYLHSVTATKKLYVFFSYWTSTSVFYTGMFFAWISCFPFKTLTAMFAVFSSNLAVVTDILHCQMIDIQKEDISL